MDAIKFLKTAKRRYDFCPHGYSEEIHLANIDFEVYVRKVEEWAKEHPIKTRQTEFLKIFPNAPIRCDGYVNVAPCIFDVEVYKKCEKKLSQCNKCLKEFWSKEVE